MAPVRRFPWISAGLLVLALAGMAFLAFLRMGPGLDVGWDTPAEQTDHLEITTDPDMSPERSAHGPIRIKTEGGESDASGQSGAKHATPTQAIAASLPGPPAPGTEPEPQAMENTPNEAGSPEASKAEPDQTMPTPTPSPAPADALQVLGVRRDMMENGMSGDATDQGETYCFALSRPAEPGLHPLPGRVYFNLPDVYQWSGLPPLPATDLVRGVRAHLHRDTARLKVVLDLADDAATAWEGKYVPESKAYCVTLTPKKP